MRIESKYICLFSCFFNYNEWVILKRNLTDKHQGLGLQILFNFMFICLILEVRSRMKALYVTYIWLFERNKGILEYK